TESGLDVQLVDIWEEHVQMIKEKGLRIDCDGQIRHVTLDIYTDYRMTRPADLVVVFVKGPQTAEAARAAAEIISQNGMVLTLQNGLSNADILAETLDPRKVITGTTSYGSMVLGPGSIRHAGIGPTIIGPWAGGDLAKVKETARVLSKGTIDTKVKEDVKALVWDKLMVNVGINAIVALTHIKNGQLVDLEITKELSRAAMEEGLAVGEALGINVRKDVVEHCWWVAEETGKTRASMGQDVDAKRQTEIGTINGAIVRLGKELGIEIPINFALTALIETWQNNYLKR
ncbi:MAG: 2-dehydropantoate 2-reductase, partial [Desulfobacteraceae bacterium]